MILPERKFPYWLLVLGALALVVLGAFCVPGADRPPPAAAARPAATTPPTARTPTPTPTIAPTPTPVPWDDIKVSDRDDEPTSCSNEALAVAGRNVAVVYYTGSSGVRCARSTDGGYTFLPSVQIHPHGLQPVVARREGAGPEDEDLYVTFYYDAVYFSRSTDGGASWSPAVIVYDGVDTWTVLSKIAVDAAGVVYVTWVEGLPNSDRGYFYLSHSADGVAWSAPVQVHQEQTGTLYTSLSSSLVVRGGVLYFAWWHWPPGSTAPYIAFTRSTDGGPTWADPVRADDAGEAAKETVDLAVDAAGVVYVVWSDTRYDGYSLPYLAHSTDGGATWSPGVRVDDAGDCVKSTTCGAVVVDEGTGFLHAALADARNYCREPYYLGWSDVFYTFSTDTGLTWSRNEQISDPIPYNYRGYALSIQAGAGFVRTAWNGDLPVPGGLLSPMWLDVRSRWTVPPTATPTITPSPSPTPPTWRVGLPWIETGEGR